jgi:hypothetical protein
MPGKGMQIAKPESLQEKMTTFMKSLVLSAALLSPLFGHAQTAVPASTKAVTVANPMTTSAPAPAAASRAPAGPAAANPAPAARNKPAAPGGGDGKVWVNTASKVYHCAGTQYYGKTKAGLYMTPAEAKAKGNHANKGCP